MFEAVWADGSDSSLTQTLTCRREENPLLTEENLSLLLTHTFCHQIMMMTVVMKPSSCWGPITVWHPDRRASSLTFTPPSPRAAVLPNSARRSWNFTIHRGRRQEGQEGPDPDRLVQNLQILSVKDCRTTAGHTNTNRLLWFPNLMNEYLFTAEQRKHQIFKLGKRSKMLGQNLLCVITSTSAGRYMQVCACSFSWWCNTPLCTLTFIFRNINMGILPINEVKISFSLSSSFKQKHLDFRVRKILEAVYWHKQAPDWLVSQSVMNHLSSFIIMLFYNLCTLSHVHVCPRQGAPACNNVTLWIL